MGFTTARDLSGSCSATISSNSISKSLETFHLCLLILATDLGHAMMELFEEAVASTLFSRSSACYLCDFIEIMSTSDGRCYFILPLTYSHFFLCNVILAVPALQGPLP